MFKDKDNSMKKEQITAEVVSPSVALNGQYIRELHFENINSPSSFMPQKESPKIEIAVNFNNRNVGEDTYEVILSVKSQAKSMDEGALTLFDIKLAYAGLVTLKNIVDEEQKEAILMIHVPSLLFPYARSVISEITKDAGFQPLMLEPMDFARIHQERKAQKEASNTKH